MTTTGKVHRLKFIHPTTLFQKIQTSHAIPKVRRLYSLFCKHSKVVSFVRIDYTGGPGGYSDAYEGHFCTKCGKVTDEVQTF